MMQCGFHNLWGARPSGKAVRTLSIVFCGASIFALGLTPVAQADGTWVQAEKIAPQNIREFDHFGRAVALSDTRAVIGSPYHGEVGTAYLFDSADGEELYQLVPQYASAGDLFGYAVAINDAWIVVTAPSDDTKGVDAGIAYVFDIATGDLIGSLFPDDPAIGDFFGVSIDIDGDRVIIGAVFDDDLGISSGSAYIFDLVTGDQLQKLVANDGLERDYFGTSVAIKGDRCLVGAPQTDSDAPGKAYIFEIDSGNQTNLLLSSDGVIGDCFGQAVALSDTVAAIGACFDDDEGPDCGAVYLFDSATGNELRQIHASDCTEGAFYGRSLSINDNLMIVGSGSFECRGGAAYIIDLDTEMEIARLTPFDQHLDDNFGRAVAVNGSRVLVGAYLDDEFGTDAGAAYFFRQYGPSNFLEISPMPLRSREIGVFDMHFTQAEERTWLLYSLTGLQPTFIRQLEVIVELQNPLLGFGPRLTDMNGDLRFNLPIPGVAYPVDIWFQAVQIGNTTNTVATVIVPVN